MIPPTTAVVMSALRTSPAGLVRSSERMPISPRFVVDVAVVMRVAPLLGKIALGNCGVHGCS